MIVLNYLIGRSDAPAALFMFERVIGQIPDGQPDVRRVINRTALLLLLLHVCGCWFPLPGGFRHCNRRQSTANMAHATGTLPVRTSLRGLRFVVPSYPTLK